VLIQAVLPKLDGPCITRAFHYWGQSMSFYWFVYC